MEFKIVIPPTWQDDNFDVWMDKIKMKLKKSRYRQTKKTIKYK